MHAVIYFGNVVLGQIVHANATLKRGLNVPGELRMLLTEPSIFRVKFILEFASDICGLDPKVV